MEQINIPSKCPNCKGKHLTEDYFCEHCMFDLISIEQAIGTDIYATWC